MGNESTYLVTLAASALPLAGCSCLFGEEHPKLPVTSLRRGTKLLLLVFAALTLGLVLICFATVLRIPALVLELTVERSRRTGRSWRLSQSESD